MRAALTACDCRAMGPGGCAPCDFVGALLVCCQAWVSKLCMWLVIAGVVLSASTVPWAVYRRRVAVDNRLWPRMHACFKKAGSQR